MTITYTAQVATCRHLGCFWKLLFRWKGSIYKLLWVNMLVYTFIFLSFKICYLYLMSPEAQLIMKNIGKYCHAYEASIPLSFLLGFYVAIVLARWWDQYLSIPWPDGLAVLVSVFVVGQDVRGRVMRRTIVRYANLTLVMVFTMVSPFVKRRFPNYQSFVDAGLLLPSEHQRLKELDKRTIHPKHWVPLVWAIAIVARARREGQIADDISKETIINELNAFRGTCGALLNYDWISIPLVYPQVVSWAVYTYFATTLISYQFPDVWEMKEEERFLVYIPIFPLLQFFFYTGWLLVAETLANPFGEDDDDFDISWLIDRNLQVSYIIADEMHNTHPELLKDQYWDNVLPPDVPWNPYPDLDDNQGYQDGSLTKDGDAPSSKKGGKWWPDVNIPTNVARTDVLSRSLDFGSERVIQIYLPPSLSRITSGSRPPHRSGPSKGSRPSGDSRIDHLPIKDFYGISPEGRTQIFSNIRTHDKEDDVHRIAPAIFDYFQIRRGEDIPYQGNYVYNSMHGPDQDMTNPSSQNLIQLGIKEKIRDQEETTSRSNSSSSLLGLDFLLSENVFQKLNDMNKVKSKNETKTVDETPAGSLDDESIILKDTWNISKDEKVIFSSKSRSLHKSILKTQDDKRQLCQDEISSHEEKSVKSVVRTISTPVTFGEDLIHDIAEITEEYPISFEDLRCQGARIEIVEKYSQHENEEARTASSSVLPITSEHRLQAESLELRDSSTSEPLAIPFQTATDYQAISDMLFDHILSIKLSNSQQVTNNYSEGEKSLPENEINEAFCDVENNASELSGQSSKNLEGTEDLIVFDSALEDSDSKELDKKESVDFVKDDFESREREESTDVNDTTNQIIDRFIHEIIDEITYSSASENNSASVLNELSSEDTRSHHIGLSDRESSENNLNEDLKMKKSMAESTDHDFDNRQEQDEIPRQLVLPTTSHESMKMENQDDSGVDQNQSLLSESQSEVEEFRQKVEQSISFKHCSITPPQPKILSTMASQQSSPLTPLLELPEEPDRDTDESPP